MRVLVSSLACSPRFGSESLVGYRTVEKLTEHFKTTLITSAGMEAPASASCEVVPIYVDEPNDVSAWQLLRFERIQRKLIERLRTDTFDVVHRLTPSGFKESLLPVPDVPLVLGPILMVGRYPLSFRQIFCPVLPRPLSSRSLLRRMQHGIARRVFQRRSTMSQLLESAALILCGTSTTRQRLPRRLHPRCRVITYAGVEHQIFSPPLAAKNNRVPQLLFTGRLVPYKGVELLLRSAARAKESGCRFELKIVGRSDPICRRNYSLLAEKLGLSNCVNFIAGQPRDALVELYQRADVFCMPSSETYGISILEAMSSGCAVLVSDISGPGEIVKHGVGVKVSLETPDQFIAEYADRICQLVDDRKLRLELSQAAREHIIREHDWGQIQNQLLEIYQELFAPPKSKVLYPVAAVN